MIIPAGKCSAQVPVRDGMTVMERWLCPNRCCKVGAWLVDSYPEYREVELVAANHAQSGWSLTATQPRCPLDGQTLRRG
jgi:hypothetical protein